MLLQSRQQKKRETNYIFQSTMIKRPDTTGTESQSWRSKRKKKKRNLVVALVQEEQEAISQKEIVSGTIFSLRKAGVLKSCA